MKYAVDFFCGAGGLTRGLLNCGVEVLLGVDFDETCKKTYESNNQASFLCADVRKLDVKVLRKRITGIPKRDLLFAGCAPCQSFSKQRKSTTRRPDGTLLSRFAYFIRECSPGHVLIENVPGLTEVSGYSAYRRFLKVLSDGGYHWAQAVVDAKHYGVAQTRKRLVLVASKHFQPTIPAITHGKGRLPFVTVKDAIGTFPAIEAGQSHARVKNHFARSLSPLNLKRLKLTPANGGDRRSWPKDVRLDCHSNNYNGHTDVYGRMSWQQPAPTLTCRCISVSNGRYGHPEQNRAISLREAASLQSFGKNYVFYGPTMESLSRQVGNAVPVRLAEALGYHLLEQHRSAVRPAKNKRKSVQIKGPNASL